VIEIGIIPYLKGLRRANVSGISKKQQIWVINLLKIRQTQRCILNRFMAIEDRLNCFFKRLIRINCAFKLAQSTPSVKMPSNWVWKAFFINSREKTMCPMCLCVKQKPYVSCVKPITKPRSESRVAKSLPPPLLFQYTNYTTLFHGFDSSPRPPICHPH
jgi:hypothetical protein